MFSTPPGATVKAPLIVAPFKFRTPLELTRPILVSVSELMIKVWVPFVPPKVRLLRVMLGPLVTTKVLAFVMMTSSPAGAPGRDAS